MEADIVIVGAGVVGLAIAAELAKEQKDKTIVLLEKYDKLGQETSSRNSEVIHSGALNYPKGSLKGKLCVEGKHLLYEFLSKWNISHERIGKLIVAQDEEEEKRLGPLVDLARENGVYDLEILDQGQLRKYEPNVNGLGGIFSPSTGIMDTHRLMERLEYLAKQGGVMFGYRHQVEGIEPSGEGYKVFYLGPDGVREFITCKWFINSAGLGACKIAQKMGIKVEEEGYKVHLCKAEYVSISNSKSHLVNHLIYPLPGGKNKFKWGHVTKHMDGTLKLGPSAYYVDEIDYTVHEKNLDDFYSGGKVYLPFLERSDLNPDMAGIRPKLSGPGEPFRDFIIKHEDQRGLKGVINLIGIESPGLTSCLAIGQMVEGIIRNY